jgi:hypothetical protein
MQDFPKDVLNYLCSYMDIHTSHNFMICCKRFFAATLLHPFRSLRSNIGCLPRQKDYKSRCYNHSRHDCDTYCIKCKLWLNHQQMDSHKLRCENRIQSPIHILDNWGWQVDKYGRCGCFLTFNRQYEFTPETRIHGPILLLTYDPEKK